MEESPLHAVMSRLIVDLTRGVDICKSNSVEEFLLLAATSHLIANMR